MKLNNKGFTLVELLAVIAIIAILGFIAVPSVINTINTSKETSYQMLVGNIYTAGKSLYEEIEYIDSDIHQYKLSGQTGEIVEINNESIKVTLQTLVSNGFLEGSNNSNLEGDNKNPKIVLSPKNNNDIGMCSIVIQKVKENGKVNYNIINDSDISGTSLENNSTNPDCPTDEEYKEVIK